MNARYKDSINLPVAIPAWGLVVMLASGIFTAGVMFQKLDTLIENSKKSEMAVSLIQERQSNDRAAIVTLQAQQSNHENRITTLERSDRSFKQGAL